MSKPVTRLEAYYESPQMLAAEEIAQCIRDMRYSPSAMKAAKACALLAIRDHLPKDATYEYIMEHFSDVMDDLTQPACEMFDKVKEPWRIPWA